MTPKVTGTQQHVAPTPLPDPSWTLGRCITVLGKTALEVVKTVGTLGLYFLLPQAAAQVAVCRGEVCYKMHTPPGAPLTKHFTPGIGIYMNPGLQLVQNATHACTLGSSFYTPSWCNKVIKAALKELSEPLQDEKKGTPAHVSVDHETKEIRLFLNPQAFFHYNEAQAYLAEAVLNNPHPFQDGVQDTIEIIKNTHYFVTRTREGDWPSLETFAEELARRLLPCNKPIDYVEVASFVHETLAQHVPSAKGRVARLLMNAVLKLGGLSEVIFADDTAYKQATVHGFTDRATFTAFLREQLAVTERYKRVLL